LRLPLLLKLEILKPLNCYQNKLHIEQKELNNAIERFLSLQQLTPEESETLATKLGLNTGSAAYPTTTPTPSLGWRIPAVIACVVGWIYYLLN